jgi:hypothetical protein
MGSASGPGDDDFDAARMGVMREVKKPGRRAMSGYNPGLERDAKAAERFGSALHGRPI